MVQQRSEQGGSLAIPRSPMEHMAPLLLGTLSKKSSHAKCWEVPHITHQQELNPNRFPTWIATLLSTSNAPAADVLMQ